MAELTVPQIDFSGIGQLPQIWKQAQNEQLRQQTLANLGQGGTADATALLKSGDLSLAQLGINMRNHQDELAHQAAADAEHKREFGMNYSLQQAAAARAAAAEARSAKDWENTPDEWIPNPNAGKPGEPTYIGQAGNDPLNMERVAAAKARAAALLPPDNYETNPDFGKVEGAPRLRPVSGGPADPTTIATQAEAKQGGGMGDGAVEIAARRLREGDLSALMNIGRGAQASRDLGRIQNKMADILVKEDGLSMADAAKKVSTAVQSFKASQTGQNAEARTGATREANLNLILKATDAAIPAALEQSEKVARTGWVPLNKIIQHGEVMTSDPELKKFAMANLQLAEHWARAMNPTGVMRESDRDKALSILSTADSKDTYRQMVGQLKTQITRERDAVKGSIPETPQFKGSGSSPAAAPSPGAYSWTPDSGLVAH
jgi:hypothetical protein